jgi:hypothetical protein
VIGQLTQKQSGSYYTPDGVVSTLLQWVVRAKEDRLIDPACGDGRFIAGHRNAVGIEQDVGAARAPPARDFAVKVARVRAGELGDHSRRRVTLLRSGAL